MITTRKWENVREILDNTHYSLTIRPEILAMVYTLGVEGILAKAKHRPVIKVSRLYNFSMTYAK